VDIEALYAPVIPALPLVAAWTLTLAQAEPAPAPAAPAAPTAGQAEPAPEEAVRPLPPPFAIGVAVGLSHRLPAAGEDVPPSFGFSISAAVGYRYAMLGERVALEVVAGFAFQRYARSFQALAPSGSYTRELSIGDFVLMQSAALLLGPLRPSLAAGAGISLGHYRSPENAAMPDEERETLVVLQGQAGLDYPINPEMDVGLRADLAAPLARPTLTTAHGDIRVFGPRLAVRLAFQVRF
jgi:hypothetical protein